MVGVKIIWANVAIRERNKIFSYWNERNGSTSYSKKLNSKIKERLQNIAANPQIGKISVLYNVRTFSLGHYSIIYKIVDTTIYVMAFWDNRQNPKKLPENLKGR